MKTEEKVQKYDHVQEPEDFYIISTNDDLILKSKETVDDLLKDLESVKYNKRLAKFYSTLQNEVLDLTKKR